MSPAASEPKRAVVLDAPTVLSGSSVIGSSPIGAPANVKDLGVPVVNAPPPPPPQPVQAAQAQPAPAVKQVRAGGDLQPGALIKRVNPVYPEILKLSHIGGTVRFSATIGRDGKLRDIQLVSGNHVLVQSATDAVKQWVYRPTTLNGEPIEVITQIDVEFSTTTR